MRQLQKGHYVFITYGTAAKQRTSLSGMTSSGSTDSASNSSCRSHSWAQQVLSHTKEAQERDKAWWACSYEDGKQLRTPLGRNRQRGHACADQQPPRGVTWQPCACVVECTANEPQAHSHLYLPRAHRVGQVHEHGHVLQALLLDGVGAVELHHQVRREHVLDGVDDILSVLLSQPGGTWGR